MSLFKQLFSGSTTPRAKCHPSPLGVSADEAWSILQQSLTPRQDEIFKWIESGGNVNWTCSNSCTLLHYAAVVNNEKMARFLLKHGAKLDAVAKYNMTPLLMACKYFATSVIPILIDHGANLSVQSEDGYTALTLIQRSTNPDMPRMEKLLLSNGAMPFPTKTPCPECGYPFVTKMAERGIEVCLMKGTRATFTCRRCKSEQSCAIGYIDKLKGIDVQCTCGTLAHIPPSSWCRTCGKGLSTGWQSKIILKK